MFAPRRPAPTIAAPVGADGTAGSGPPAHCGRPVATPPPPQCRRPTTRSAGRRPVPRPAAASCAARNRRSHRPQRRRLGIETRSVVDDVERHRRVEVGQRDHRPRRPACLATLVSASWATRYSASSASGRQRSTGSPVTCTSAGTPVRCCQPGSELGQRLWQPGADQPDRLHRGHRPAGLDQALPGQPAGQVEPARGVRRRLAVADRLELGDDAGQSLGERVVDLPGHPPTLLGDAGVAGLRDELRVQRGVLGERRLQPAVDLGQFLDGAATLLVLPFDQVAVVAESADQQRC